ncbi:MAG: HAD family hydrolase [Candidatus Heimdallarchaeum endolithica]|uniref:HAD family hydrolase n=1 Tax=Candidatus Heimdallarchaeum endolithica TaxID=2876572 RepID=A0A9Y1FQB8_9ARCH|nr:MAG: HAD family hydrolase [Candidatus Heimdallarchaeum endolithica]
MKKWEGYAILCDMDGVIISIKERWIKPFEKALRKVKQDIDEHALKEQAPSLLLTHGGRSKKIWLRAIFKVCSYAGLSRFQSLRVIINIGLMLLKPKNFKIVPFDEVEQTLQNLKDLGFKLALVTTASNFTIRRLKKLYPEIHSKYDFIFTRNDVKFTKPFPDQLNLAIKKLEVERNKCVMIGDLMTDILAGKNAGVKTVAILSEYPFITEALLSSVEPDHMIESFSLLPDYLNDIFKLYN